MKLFEYLKKSHTHSAKASNSVRQLSFAGIAVSWIFSKRVIDDVFELDRGFIISIIIFCMALLFDFLQYFSLAFIWKRFHRRIEKERAIASTTDSERDRDIQAPPYLNKVGYFFYYAKAVAVILGFTILVVNMYSRVIK